MELSQFLKKNEKTIVKNWFDSVAESYPPDTIPFIKSQKNQFSNPIGSTLIKGLEAVFQELLSGMNHSAISESLDPIIRIRAVQDFTPSKAAGFVFFLKQIIREILKNEIDNQMFFKEIVVFEDRIDQIGFIAFDIYMKCREQIYEIRANEVRNRTFYAFQRAGLIAEDSL